MASSFANTQDLVPIESIENNAVVLKNGHLLRILMVSGINFALKSDEEQNIITYAYQNFLNSLDFPIQIVIHSRKLNIASHLERLKRRMNEESSELLKSQIGEYREFISSFVSENPIMIKTFFLVVSFSPLVLPKKEMFASFLPFLKSEKTDASATKATEEKHREQEKQLVQLDQRVSQIQEGLTSIGLESEMLQTEALIELFYNFYNPETIERSHIPISQNKESKTLENTT